MDRVKASEILEDWLLSEFFPRLFSKALRLHFQEVFFTNAAPNIEDPTFTGDGLDDMSTLGTFSPPAAKSVLHYVIEIDGTGKPNTYKWSDDDGDTWDATGVSIIAGSKLLNNGVYINFGATSGHTLGDQWDFFAAYKTAIRTYVVPTEASIFFERFRMPCYVIVTGGQEHVRHVDCITKYNFKIMALTQVNTSRKSVEGGFPASKYITTDDMLGNLKQYLDMEQLRTNLKTKGFKDNKIQSGGWLTIEPPVYLQTSARITREGQEGTPFLRQNMTLSYNIK